MLEFDYDHLKESFRLANRASFPDVLYGIRFCASKFGYFGASSTGKRELLYTSREDSIGVQKAPKEVIGMTSVFESFHLDCHDNEFITVTAKLCPTPF